MSGAPHIIDLPDFVVKEYGIRFKINEHSYVFTYEEASVDEVLKMMMASQTAFVDTVKASVTAFLMKHASEGTDKEQLAKDLTKVPYKSNSGQLDFITIKQNIDDRFEKKSEDGDERSKEKESSPKARRG